MHLKQKSESDGTFSVLDESNKNYCSIPLNVLYFASKYSPKLYMSEASRMQQLPIDKMMRFRCFNEKQSSFLKIEEILEKNLSGAN